MITFKINRYFIVLLILLSTHAWAQSADKSVTGGNEARIDLLNTLLGSLEVQYERILSDHITLGTNVGIGYSFLPNSGNIFRITPTYRQYFGEQKAAGFFIESSVKYTYDYKWDGMGQQKIKVSNLGFGVGTGYKLIIHGKMVGTVKSGIGRYVKERESVGFFSGNQFYGNFEISLGRRF